MEFTDKMKETLLLVLAEVGSTVQRLEVIGANEVDQVVAFIKEKDWPEQPIRESIELLKSLDMIEERDGRLFVTEGQKQKQALLASMRVSMLPMAKGGTA
jgi:hypothetical protein